MSGSLSTPRKIWIAFLAMEIVIMGSAFLVWKGQSPEQAFGSLRFSRDAFRQPYTFLMIFFGVLESFMAFVISNRVMAMATDAESRLKAYIVRLAFFEMVALFGLALGTLLQNPLWTAPFVVWSTGLLLFNSPGRFYEN